MDDKAIETIKMMRLDLREPLELRGTMESAIRSAICRADEYLRQAQEAPKAESIIGDCGDDRPNAGCAEDCPDSCPHKPASVQSAEELADKVISEFVNAKRSNPGAAYSGGILSKAEKLIEADRAAQRQAGREEAGAEIKRLQDHITQHYTGAATAYIKELECKVGGIVEALRGLGSSYPDGMALCFCEMRNGNPMIKEHSTACIRARKTLSDLDEAKPKGRAPDDTTLQKTLEQARDAFTMKVDEYERKYYPHADPESLVKKIEALMLSEARKP